MKRIVLALALAIGFVAGVPVVAPDHAAQAQAVFIARTTDSILVYTWMWVSMPGQPNGGQWVLIAVDPAL